jgi:hypothetical protein
MKYSWPDIVAGRAQTNNQAAQAVSQNGNAAMNQAQAGEDPD